MRNFEDILVYRDDKSCSILPSIIRRPDRELLVAFRRAPDRRRLGEHGPTRTDTNSYLALVRRRGGLDALQPVIGAVDEVQGEWHGYARRLEAALAGSDLGFFKSVVGYGSTPSSSR